MDASMVISAAVLVQIFIPALHVCLYEEHIANSISKSKCKLVQTQDLDKYMPLINK